MAQATQRYNFSTYAVPIELRLEEVRNFLQGMTNVKQAKKFERLKQLQTALETRMRQINAKSPSINGKSTNPFVLAAYAELFEIQHLKQVDNIVAAAKVFSSLETAAGRVVEDVIPPFYGWAQINSPGHTVLSEIDCARIVGDTVHLIALKSGPMCINDSMVSQIANAISTHWLEWSDHWKVKNVRFIIGMNYSTAKNSNKKDWHIVRLTEEKTSAAGLKLEQSCTQLNMQRPIARSFFEGRYDGKTLRVETLQGRELWSHVADAEDAFLQICWAMVKCLNTTDTPVEEIYSTGQMKEIINFAKKIDLPDISSAEKQWLVLFARHFVDQLNITQSYIHPVG